jgi:hypothetical protein
MKNILLSFLLFFLSPIPCLIAQIPYPGNEPEKAAITEKPGKHVILENNAVKMEFVQDGKSINILSFENKETHDQLKTADASLFEIAMHDGSIYTAHDFKLINLPVEGSIAGNPESTTYAEQLPGKKYSANFENEKLGINLHWEANLKDGSNYVRQIFRFKVDDPKKISKIILVKFSGNIGLSKEGIVDGSPIVNNDMFFAVEYPLSKVEHDKTYISAYLTQLLGEVSTVWGVTPTNQLRRGFLYYVERERIHPYHQVLHYNSWYDISWDKRKFDEKECLDRIKVFGDSLVKKRNVKMKAFLFDDGWDDNTTLWKFHSGFPDGFARIRNAAGSLNADLGVWLSPFGGYGEAKDQRIVYGNKQIPPFETNERGFSLAGPVYYNRFKEVTSNFIKDYNVSMFKFDGVGAGSGAEIVYQKDVEAFLKLLKDLLAIKPDLYLSLTSGTWPSVYWLMYGDNIWRGGDDTNMRGEGSKRQQWINYRDADTYQNVVKRGPLFPLNSLMLCGICIADYGYPGMFEMNDKDIKDEIWSFFATGTNLQELYINPHKLNTANWDCLAAASTWAKENEAVMTDVHWVGGDPAKNEIYGFAAWTPEKAVLSLRNPASVEQTFDVKCSRVFELPANMNDEFCFYNVVADKVAAERKIVAQGKSFNITLQPFEVRVFDATPMEK